MSARRGAPEPSPGASDLAAIAREHPVDAVPIAAPDDTAGEVRSRLADRSFASAHDVVVLSEGRCVGLVALEALLAARGDTDIASLMDRQPAILAAGSEPGAAAHRMVARGESSIVVVGADGQFLGLVPPRRMVSLLLEEHDEDLARIGGYIAGSDRARGAVTESVRLRLWHRFPWLLVGLVGAMASAVLVGAFEDSLRENVLVALFVPAVVYMSGAVATQTQTVLIRALAAGVSFRPIIGRELLTGGVIGLLIAVAFYCFAAAGWGDEQLAFAVGVALFASCVIASALAIALPAAFERFGQDPAFGSGPLVTVIQDLLAILAYFAAISAMAL